MFTDAERIIAETPPVAEPVFVEAVAEICKACLLEHLERGESEQGWELMALCLVVAAWMSQNGYGPVLRN